MSDETHPCEVGVCDREVPRGMLMCRPHWYMVPKETRAEVWKWWRRISQPRSGRMGLEETQNVFFAYRTARDKAIAAVEKQLEYNEIDRRSAEIEAEETEHLRYD